MTDKIVTRTFQYGDEKESEWPPKFGTVSIFGDEHGGLFHIDEETGETREGPPPYKYNYFGRSANVHQDSMEPYFHPGINRYVDTRRGLQEADRASGMISSGTPLPADDSLVRERAAQRKRDREQAIEKAHYQVTHGYSPLTEDQKAFCRKSDEAAKWQLRNGRKIPEGGAFVEIQDIKKG